MADATSGLPDRSGVVTGSIIDWDQRVNGPHD
jgi:hypothetical protein